MLITSKDIDWSAAKTKRETFERLFPHGAELTIETARMATHAGLSLRCGAKQLMGTGRYLAFCKRAKAILTLYLENTTETREAVNRLCPTARKMEWMEADAAHEENKLKHWGGYLDGLAKAFVLGFKEQPETA